MTTPNGHPPRPRAARRDGVAARTATTSPTTGIVLDGPADPIERG